MADLSMRERLARAVYSVTSNDCLVPFADQGPVTRKQAYAVVDAVLAALMKAPEVIFDIAQGPVIQDDNGINCHRILGPREHLANILTAILEGK